MRSCCFSLFFYFRLKINWRWHRAVEEHQPLEDLSKSRVCGILSKHLPEQCYIIFQWPG